MLDHLTSLARAQTGRAPQPPDLTRREDLELARGFAEELLAADPDAATLRAMEEELTRDRDAWPLLVHLGLKLALSRRLVRDLEGPAHLSVVFAMFKEHQRILTPAEIPGGEDFLRRKAAQLDWLCAEKEDLDWSMVAVDDGCPEGSGDIAERIAQEAGLAPRVQVLRLAEAIRTGEPVVAGLQDPSESMKGGSVELGLWHAARADYPNHVVAFTDADLSTHLGQCGLLMDAILRGGADAAIGSRRLAASVALKQGSRNLRGKLFIYLWKRIIGVIPEIIDTQCGFKAFRAEVVRDIVPGMLERRFAFDIELLIKTQLRRENSIRQIPVAWIDSDTLSTTTDLQPYLPMLRAMVGMYRHYLPADPTADTFAAFLDGLDEAGWERLQDNIPAAIAERAPAEFVEFAGVSAADLEAASRA
ncbi:hypothetical protein CSB20_00895 [bacterium DOLZORAL124_64_63]|nr:MAG: hypothetical protein CSB20_00895 [bacterium DOLZORAL124_64_63]